MEHFAWNIWVRRITLLGFVCLIIASISIASSELEVTGDLPQNFGDDHPFTKFRTYSGSAFPAGSSVPKIAVNVFFGVDAADPIDRAGLDSQGSKLANYANFDPDFDLTSHDTQLAIKELCDTIAADDTLVVDAEVYCFIDDFEEYVFARASERSERAQRAQSDGYSVS